MIITPDFVYLHHPKTGGTFVTKMLYQMSRQYPEFKVTEPPRLKHSGRSKIPQEYAHLPVVTNIRYLLDHYVSRYEFRWWTRPGFFRPEIKQVLPHFPEISFKEFMQIFCNWHYRTIPKNRAARLVTSDIGGNTRAITRILGIGRLKFLEKHDQMSDEELQAKFHDVHLLKSHSLNADLSDLIQSTGASKGKTYNTEFILSSGRILPKLGGRGETGKNWKNYFDDELVDMVLLKDRLLLRTQPWLLEEFPSGSRERLDEIIKLKQAESMPAQ